MLVSVWDHTKHLLSLAFTLIVFPFSHTCGASSMYKLCLCYLVPYIHHWGHKGSRSNWYWPTAMELFDSALNTRTGKSFGTASIKLRSNNPKPKQQAVIDAKQFGKQLQLETRKREPDCDFLHIACYWSLFMAQQAHYCLNYLNDTKRFLMHWHMWPTYELWKNG